MVSLTSELLSHWHDFSRRYVWKTIKQLSMVNKLVILWYTFTIRFTFFKMDAWPPVRLRNTISRFIILMVFVWFRSIPNMTKIILKFFPKYAISQYSRKLQKRPDIRLWNSSSFSFNWNLAWIMVFALIVASSMRRLLDRGRGGEGRGGEKGGDIKKQWMCLM